MRAELTEKEIKALRRAIFNHFSLNRRFDRHGKLVSQPVTAMLCDDYLGLAYTSSSSWAGLWPCNEAVYLDIQNTWEYAGFGMDMGGYCVAWLTDGEENELYIFI